jgi:hypothetical protein
LDWQPSFRERSAWLGQAGGSVNAVCDRVFEISIRQASWEKPDTHWQRLMQFNSLEDIQIAPGQLSGKIDLSFKIPARGRFSKFLHTILHNYFLIFVSVC